MVPGGSNPPSEKHNEAADHELAGKQGVDVPRGSPLPAVPAREEVAKVVLAWASLSPSIRAAILALVEAGKEDDAT